MATPQLHASWKHKALFNKLWAKAEILARETFALGGYVAIEWPRYCSYWGLLRVLRLIRDLGLVEACFDGCRFGLKDSKGTPLKKPWKVMTNCPSLAESLAGKLCKRDHVHSKCAGSETK